VIVSAGYRNAFRHPNPQIVARYHAIGAKVWRTDEGGAIGVRFDADGVLPQAYRESQRRYWYGE
jgi:competence protein ComEC